MEAPVWLSGGSRHLEPPNIPAADLLVQARAGFDDIILTDNIAAKNPRPTPPN